YVCFHKHPTTTAIYTLSLHDALPILAKLGANSAEIVFGLLLGVLGGAFGIGAGIQSVNGFHQRQRFLAIGRFAFRNVGVGMYARSEEHTSELQSRENLVCRLLLEKKK